MTTISTITAYLEHQSKQVNHCDFKDWVIDALAVMSETDARSLMNAVERNNYDSGNEVRDIIAALLVASYRDKADDWQREQNTPKSPFKTWQEREADEAGIPLTGEIP